MPKVKIDCANCGNCFERDRWEYNRGLKRNKNFYCSEYCKNHRQGNLANNWNGGKWFSRGYAFISTGNGGRIAEHRLVAEKKLGRKLRKGEVVHHLNGKPADNRPENLVVCKTAGQHASKYHPRKREKGMYV